MYSGLCRAEAHASWLGNVLDREARELAVANESPLFEQSLASMTNRNFQDILEQQAQQRTAEDKGPEDEDMA